MDRETPADHPCTNTPTSAASTTQEWRRKPRWLGISAARNLLSGAGRRWSGLGAHQKLVLGFLSYALVGMMLLAIPWSTRTRAPLLDHLFTAVSAVSTTGLATVNVGEVYSPLGLVVILVMFQLGGLGYMTLSSILVIASGRPLSDDRLGVIRAGFSLPRNFHPKRFVVHAVVYTGVIELIGTLLLWWRFAALGVEDPLWSALFHSVSAFATAGFGLYGDSLERFRDDLFVNTVIGGLCFAGSIGFIVVQDVWYSVRFRERMLTFTSTVILVLTGAIFVATTLLIYCFEPTIHERGEGSALLAAAFQAMSASTTAGFNTVPIGPLAAPVLLSIIAAMLIGASPSGTGGGMKTTTVSAMSANMLSTLRGRERVVLLGREIPMQRVLLAAAASWLYLIFLAVGVVALAAVERRELMPMLFEAASALGTVGLSMGITGDLSPAGKLILIGLMFVGRCGPLTLGFALLAREHAPRTRPIDDLAV